ncbi:unnamed protein product [Calypogeia fissa]
MHILALCLFKKYCELLVSSVDRSDQKTFEDALSEVTARRPKGFDGRWPKKPFDRLGYFKAEEFTRFIIFCVPHILREIGIRLDSSLGILGLLLVDISRLFYIKSRDEGWSVENMTKARSLLASWRVWSEEAGGPSGAILEHVANEPYGCKNMVMSKGVGIGSTRKKKQALGTSMLTSLKQCWKDAGLLQDSNRDEHMSDTGTPLRAVVWRKQVYRPGDHVVVLLDGSSNPTDVANWKAVIQTIFMHEFMGRMELFFEAIWYKQKRTEDRRRNFVTWDRDEYSQFTILEPEPLQYQGNNCRLVSRILHKFFPVHWTGTGGALEVVAMEVGDTLVRELPQSISNCPPWPEVGDIMTTIEGSLCVIREVLLPSRDEFIVEDEPVLEDAADDDSDPVDVTDETPVAHSPNTDIGTVNVSWLVGPRGPNQEYKALPRMDANLHFETLLLLRTSEF